MKKTVVILLVFTMLFSMAACGSGQASIETAAPAADPGTAAAAKPSAPLPSAAPEAIPENTDIAEPEPATAVPAEEAPAVQTVDVDLTQLSSTMVYSEVYAMVYEPQKYTGKTVKMRGLFNTTEYNGTRLYACIVQDATACCAQGLEFEMAEELVYPDDYPEPGSEITVVGTFDSYTEDAGNGNMYMYLVLRNARFA